jgi:UDP-N-acetylmuramate: L-alanyl-gamma-D-glutamyl-meso-diaminopimelate ligase
VTTLNKPRSIHLIGVAGTGMGAFAGLLKAAGYDVRGSDENVYPPMSEKLQEWGIPARMPYAAANLDPPPDLTVVGNVVRKDNVEATAMRERGLPHASFPQTLGDLFLSQRWSTVVAGTHGKTTTTSLLAWTLMSAGRDPGLLVGGIPLNFGESFRLGRQAPDSPFVVEGDEYDTAYFDKGPKFLHYRPKSLLATSLEYDHADIYQDVEQIVARFAQLFALVPKEGRIVVCAEEQHLRRALHMATPVAPVTMYGEGGEYTASQVVEDERGLRFAVLRGELHMGELSLSLSGRHSVLNALGAYAILESLGLKHHEIQEGYATFESVKRRMEVVGEAFGVTVVDDFAHHPTAVATTLAGAVRKYAGRKVWAIFEPRSATSCRKIFQDDYARAFREAHHVVLAPSGRQLDPDVALDVAKLARDVAAGGVPAWAAPSIDAIVDTVAKDAENGAVLLCMSNGGFGGIHGKLLAALRARSGAGP